MNNFLKITVTNITVPGVAFVFLLYFIFNFLGGDFTFDVTGDLGDSSYRHTSALLRERGSSNGVQNKRNKSISQSNILEDITHFPLKNSQY